MRNTKPANGFSIDCESHVYRKFCHAPVDLASHISTTPKANAARPIKRRVSGGIVRSKSSTSSRREGASANTSPSTTKTKPMAKINVLISNQYPTSDNRRIRYQVTSRSLNLILAMLSGKPQVTDRIQRIPDPDQRLAQRCCCVARRLHHG